MCLLNITLRCAVMVEYSLFHPVNVALLIKNVLQTSIFLITYQHDSRSRDTLSRQSFTSVAWSVCVHLCH